MANPSRRQVITGGAFALAAPLLSRLPLGCTPTPPGSELATVTIGPYVRDSILRFGCTHVNGSLTGNPAAITNAKTIRDRCFNLESTQMYWWGMLNPSDPTGDPLQANWRHSQGTAGLDDRIGRVMTGPGEKHIAFAVCPDEWADPGTAPLPPRRDRAGIFAQLCARIAERYTGVKHFSVWNEMKGMWLGGSTQTWDNARYVELYNAVYAAVIAVRPDAIIYGPYVVMRSYADTKTYTTDLNGIHMDRRALDTLKFFLKNRDTPTGWQDHQGIAIDMSSASDGAPVGNLDKWSTVDSWIRALDPTAYKGADTLPINIAEWYSSNGPAPRTDAQDAAGVAADLAATLYTSASMAIMWQPQASANTTKAFPLAAWTSTLPAGGGQGTALVDVLEAFQLAFPSGTPLYRVTAPAGITGVCGPAGGKMILSNRDPVAKTVAYETHAGAVLPLSMAGWAVEVVGV